MELISQQYQSLIDDCDDLITLYSNTSAFIMQSFPNISWVGFYLNKYGHLQLGPFQGKVACELLDLEKGVCGTAFSRKTLLNVANVHEFPGHIACDSASKSELVVPLIYQNRRLGVLDMDSPAYDRFTYEDEETMSRVADLIAEALCK